MSKGNLIMKMVPGRAQAQEKGEQKREIKCPKTLHCFSCKSYLLTLKTDRCGKMYTFSLSVQWRGLGCVRVPNLFGINLVQKASDSVCKVPR